MSDVIMIYKCINGLAPNYVLNYISGPIHTHITPGSKNILVYLYVEHL